MRRARNLTALFRETNVSRTDSSDIDEFAFHPPLKPELCLTLPWWTKPAALHSLMLHAPFDPRPSSPSHPSVKIWIWKPSRRFIKLTPTLPRAKQQLCCLKLLPQTQSQPSLTLGHGRGTTWLFIWWPLVTVRVSIQDGVWISHLGIMFPCQLLVLVDFIPSVSWMGLYFHWKPGRLTPEPDIKKICRSQRISVLTMSRWMVMLYLYALHCC